MKKIFVLSFLISIILVLSLLGLRELPENSIEKGQAQLTIKTIGETTTESIDAGTPLIESLEKTHSIKLGPALKCIDTVCNNGNYWWHFYVNEKRTLETVKSYIPKKGDKIKLEMGE